MNNKLTKDIDKQFTNSNPIYNKSKFLIGFLLLPIGPFGLLIGLHEYPKGTYARKTFLKGFFSILIVAAIISAIAIVVLLIVSLVESI